MWHVTIMRLSCDYHVTQLRYVLEEKVLEVEIELGMKDGYDYPFIAEGIVQISNYTITVSNIELDLTHCRRASH